jgi:hypothetical protein
MVQARIWQAMARYSSAENKLGVMACNTSGWIPAVSTNPMPSSWQRLLIQMFRWYRDATRCYVYLSDISRYSLDSADKPNEDWESAFRKSKWFTRGWTLQELIAPTSVEFFSKEWELLGNKISLERQICEVTVTHKSSSGRHFI